LGGERVHLRVILRLFRDLSRISLEGKHALFVETQWLTRQTCWMGCHEHRGGE
jgi:hypothetical protein